MICVSCSVHLISRRTTCAKDYGLFYLNYPQINGVQNSDHMVRLSLLLSASQKCISAAKERVQLCVLWSLRDIAYLHLWVRPRTIPTLLCKLLYVQATALCNTSTCYSRVSMASLVLYGKWRGCCICWKENNNNNNNNTKQRLKKFEVWRESWTRSFRESERERERGGERERGERERGRGTERGERREGRGGRRTDGPISLSLSLSLSHTKNISPLSGKALYCKW